MRLRLPALVGRAGWNLLDQVISSGTNAVLSFLVARSVDATAFGGFAVAFTVFSLLVGASRALATSPLSVRYADAEPARFQGAAAVAVGSALTLGLVGGLACLAVGAALGGGIGQALVALGVVFPALLAQDAWRFVFFAASRPAAAALNDAVWAVVQIGAVALVLAAGRPGAATLVLAWGGAAAVAALVGVRQARAWPRPLDSADWFRRHRSLTGYLVAEFGMLQGCQQGALLVVAAVGSLEAIGALRGVQVLLGPTTILGVAAFSFIVPELARRRPTATAQLWIRGALGVSAVVSVLGFTWGVIFVVAPDAVGRALLGDTWPSVSEILWPTIIGQLGATLPHGPSCVLIAMDRARASLMLNIVYAPLIFIGGVGGVLLGGAYGAAWGFAAAFWVMVPLWWLRLLREVRHVAATGPARPSDR